MVIYPISVPLNPYRGNDELKKRKTHRHNQIARMCEEYLNSKIQQDNSEIQQYLYYSIASDLQLTVDEVRDVLFKVDCGYNGLTVKRQ